MSSPDPPITTAEPATSASSHASKWPFTCPDYDPLTMRSSVLQGFNERLIYSPRLLHCVEVFNQELRTANVPIDEEGLREEFIADLKQRDPQIIILLFEHIFSHRHAADGEQHQINFTVSVDASTWIWMLEEFRVYPLFVECIHDMMGRFSTFVTYSAGGTTAEIFHLLIKVPPAGHLEGAFYLQYHFSTKKIILLVAGNDLKAHLENLVEQLIESMPNHHPFGLVLEIINRYLRFLDFQRRELFHAVVMMERKTGRGAVSYSDGEPDDPDPESFNLTNMHWIGANQRNVTFAMNYQLRLSGFLHTALQRFASLTLGKPVVFETMPRREKMINQALTAHRTSVTGALEECRVVAERAQWQLTAADTMISTWIAKQSQRTADESKSIAFETRKDSTSMKTIAGLTMVYLPSTFMATIFGMDFFTFDQADVLTVKSDIWKFVVVAVVLTVLTISCWIWLNARGIPRWLRWTRSAAEARLSGQKGTQGQEKELSVSNGTQEKMMTYTHYPGRTTV